MWATVLGDGIETGTTGTEPGTADVVVEDAGVNTPPDAVGCVLVDGVERPLVLVVGDDAGSGDEDEDGGGVAGGRTVVVADGVEPPGWADETVVVLVGGGKATTPTSSGGDAITAAAMLLAGSTAAGAGVTAEVTICTPNQLIRVATAVTAAHAPAAKLKRARTSP